MAKTFTHDPNAKLDYQVDWADWLQASETISTSTWTVPSGITQASPAPSNTTSTATIWLSGGELGKTYDVVNHIVTNQGREDDRTVAIEVKQR